MADVRIAERNERDIARAREIVSRHRLPDFVNGFDIRLDTVEDHPALYVVYSEDPYRGGADLEEALRRADAYGELNRVILDDLLAAFDDRLPYWLSVESPTPG